MLKINNRRYAIGLINRGLELANIACPPAVVSKQQDHSWPRLWLRTTETVAVTK